MAFLLCRRMLLWSILLVGWGYALPAFPGAEGFGSETPGGRGGEVVVVNTLIDPVDMSSRPYTSDLTIASGKMSLREAIENRNYFDPPTNSRVIPRTIVFNVAGRIDLHKSLEIKEGFLTLAGQTAPGDGICLKASDSMYNALIEIHSNDIILRYIRLRPGEGMQGNNFDPSYGGPSGGIKVFNADDCELDGLAMFDGSSNVIIDHCSISWAIDENIQIIGINSSSSPRDITISNSIISEGLFKSVHPKGAHSKGAIIAYQTTGNISFHHNIFASNHERNPKFKAPGPFSVYNNYIYMDGMGGNERGGCDATTNLDGPIISCQIDFWGNSIKHFAANNDIRGLYLWTHVGGPISYFTNNNTMNNIPTTFPEAADITIPSESSDNGIKHCFPLKDVTPDYYSPFNLLSSLNKHVGASFPIKDITDKRVLSNVIAGVEKPRVDCVVKGSTIRHHKGEISSIVNSTSFCIDLGASVINPGNSVSLISPRLEDKEDPNNFGMYKDYKIRNLTTNSPAYIIDTYSTHNNAITLIGNPTNVFTATGQEYEILVNTTNGAETSWPTYSGIPYSSNEIDGCGMFKSWTKVYNVISPAADPDNDGYTNIEEFLNGTTPNYIHVEGDKEQGIRSLFVSPVEVPIAEYAAVRNILPDAFDLSGKPITNISWYDAVEYCNALSDSTGFEQVYEINKSVWPHIVTSDLSRNGYRLPTIEEWEYLYRGGYSEEELLLEGYGDCYFQNSAPTSGDYAWYEWSACEVDHSVAEHNPTLHTVGLLIPNGYGLYDMAGNVSEWVHSEDASGRNYVKSCSYIDRLGDLGFETTWGPREKSNKSIYRGFRVVRNAPVDITPINAHFIK